MPTTLQVEVTARVRAIRALSKSDPEAAHSNEDRLYADVLKAIAEGNLTKADAMELAQTALKTKAATFPRWTA